MHDGFISGFEKAAFLLTDPSKYLKILKRAPRLNSLQPRGKGAANRYARKEMAKYSPQNLAPMHSDRIRKTQEMEASFSKDFPKGTGSGNNELTNMRKVLADKKTGPQGAMSTRRGGGQPQVPKK